MSEITPEPNFSNTLPPEVRRYVATAITKGTIAALLELNSAEPPLDREQRESAIFNSLEILRQRHKGNEDIGKAESLVKLVEISRRRKRAQHILRISQN